MGANRANYVAAMKALGSADEINLSNSERDACNVVIADYTCGGKASLKPSKREIEAVHGAAGRVSVVCFI